MQKVYIGRNREENLTWLSKSWLKSGPPVCYLHGFSGVGKTDLARDLRELAVPQGFTPAIIHEVADRATPSVLESLMELSTVLSQYGQPEMEQELFESSRPHLGRAVEEALQTPVLLILDESQRFFQPETSTPLPEFLEILSLLRNRPQLPGRLLLLSDRIVEDARWSEWIPKRTLTKLDLAEALQAFDQKLAASGVEVTIPQERKREVLEDLDFNPRAIEALVGALRYDTLDDIISSNPGLWSVSDRQVSRQFLHALERDLLERTVRHLQETHRRKLRRLAVHRRSFRREAMEKLGGTKAEQETLRSVLITHYLVNFYRGTLSLNPIVREISLGYLRETSAEFRQAHSNAADYHLRHFKAKQIVGDQARLGQSFAELRYHLVHARRNFDLHEIGRRFTSHLQREIRNINEVPSDPDELDERIGVLTVLLDGGGAPLLEYHLGICLHTRNQPGDLAPAAMYLERSLGPRAPFHVWRLAVTLGFQAEGIQAMNRIVALGVAAHQPPMLDHSFYKLGAEVLVELGETGHAIQLLRQGIAQVTPDQGSNFLYIICAKLLFSSGTATGEEEAIALLREGITKIPFEHDVQALYNVCSGFLVKMGRLDGPNGAIALLHEGIAIIPPEHLAAMYNVCSNFLVDAGRVEGPGGAIAILREGIAKVPLETDLVSLYRKCATLLAQLGQLEGSDGAISLLREGISKFPPQHNLSGLYAAYANILVGFGKVEGPDGAIALLREGIAKIPPQHHLEGLCIACANLLAGTGKTEGPDGAIALLREGIAKIPPQYNVEGLYAACANLLVGIGKTEGPDGAIALLREGITKIPPQYNVEALFLACATMLAGVGKTGGPDGAIALLREGITKVPPQYNVVGLYTACANMLAGIGETEGAIALLREGISEVPPQYNGVGLYTLCASILFDLGKLEGPDGAIALLREGISEVPPQYNGVGLYTLCASILFDLGKLEGPDGAISLLETAVNVTPTNAGRSVLNLRLADAHCRRGDQQETLRVLNAAVEKAQTASERVALAEFTLRYAASLPSPSLLSEILQKQPPLDPQNAIYGPLLLAQMQGDWQAATDLAINGRATHPGYVHFSNMLALSLLAKGDAVAAERVFTDLPPTVEFSEGTGHTWLLAFVLLRRTDPSRAEAMLSIYLGRPVNRDTELNEAFLLHLWDAPDHRLPYQRHLPHLFPILPASMTGIGRDARHLPYGKPVLGPAKTQSVSPPAFASSSGSDPHHAPTVSPSSPPHSTPDIYVSYAWGDHSSPDAIRREEIVDQLCAALHTAGHRVGRDKHDMHAGDSIDAFSNKIARARRIIAVVSAKSLHSRFCMVDELFGAYQRCGMRTREFKEKVIALVMDDARPLLSDDISLVTHWRNEYNQQRIQLEKADPNRRSQEKWDKLNRLQDMCDHLLDMTASIRDIIMPRGYEAIVQGRFQEVIDRLRVPHQA